MSKETRSSPWLVLSFQNAITYSHMACNEIYSTLLPGIKIKENGHIFPSEEKFTRI